MFAKITINSVILHCIYTDLKCVNRIVHPMHFALFVNRKRTWQGSFLNVTECLIRGMASVSGSHTGGALAMHLTKNDSDVILGDRCHIPKGL